MHGSLVISTLVRETARLLAPPLEGILYVDYRKDRSSIRHRHNFQRRRALPFENTRRLFFLDPSYLVL